MARERQVMWVVVAMAAGLAVAAVATAWSGRGNTPATALTTASVDAAAVPARIEQPLQTRLIEAIRAVSPSVVQIETPAGLGSGVVVDGGGNIVTNNHVVGTYKTFRVTSSSGRRYTATLVGTFASGDLAVIHVEGAKLPAARLGDSSSLEVGDIVLAVGNPLGLQSSVTNGIVSALGRTVGEDNGVALPGVIQTSAPINPGNSGGALVDLGGSVIGIPTLTAVDPENNQLADGIGFAIPSNTVSAISHQLIDRGRVVSSGRGYMGVVLTTPVKRRGVMVVSVTPAGPAASASIAHGDTITAIDDSPVRTVDDAATIVARLRPGSHVSVTIRTPRGRSRAVTVVLGEAGRR